jgi:hypothetical protein
MCPSYVKPIETIINAPEDDWNMLTPTEKHFREQQARPVKPETWNEPRRKKVARNPVGRVFGKL